MAPELGRGFDAKDEQPGNAQVAIVSHELWQTVLGGRADVLASTLRLDGVPYRVVGVMPAEFGYPHKTDLAYADGHVGDDGGMGPFSFDAATEGGER